MASLFFISALFFFLFLNDRILREQLLHNLDNYSNAGMLKLVETL